MQNRPTVVIDKSYLRAASHDCMRGLAISHKFLVCESLTYEVSKDAPEIRADVFSKLPEPTTGWEYIPSVSWLIDYERKYNIECGRPSSHIVKRDYSIIETLKNPKQQLPDNVSTAIKKLEHFFDDFSDALLLQIENLFQTTTPKKAEEELDALLKGEIRNEEKTNELIFSSTGAKLPDIRRFTPNSVTFRYFQVMTLYSYDMRRRYNSIAAIKNSTKARQKILHDAHDLNYLILALLEGKFATQERKLQNWWNTMENSESLIHV